MVGVRPPAVLVPRPRVEPDDDANFTAAVFRAETPEVR
jgi:hypothetical protein